MMLKIDSDDEDCRILTQKDWDNFLDAWIKWVQDDARPIHLCNYDFSHYPETMTGVQLLNDSHP